MARIFTKFEVTSICDQFLSYWTDSKTISCFAASPLRRRTL